MKFEICLFFIYLGVYGATSIDNPIASQIDKSSVSPLRDREGESARNGSGHGGAGSIAFVAIEV